METDIGNPIDYNPNIDPLNNDKNEEPVQEEHPYYVDYPIQPPMPPPILRGLSYTASNASTHSP
jgi:hypothetical protein